MTLNSAVEDLIERSKDPLLSCCTRWRRVELDKIADIQSGFPFQSRFFNFNTGVPLIRIRDLTTGRPKTLYSGPIPDGYWVEDGDLLIALDGDFQLVRWNGSKGLLNQRVARLKIKDKLYEPEFMTFILPQYLRALNEATSSVTVKHLSVRSLRQLPLPYPPPSEQRRIMLAVEQKLGFVRAINSQLESIASKVETIRSNAFHQAYRAESAAGWEWKFLGEIADISTGLTLGKKYNSQEQLVERPYLRVANVQRGSLALTDVRTVKVRASEVARYMLDRGDILMNEGGDRDKLGRGWIWEDQIDECLHQNHVFRVRLRPGQRVTPKYLARYANFVGSDFFSENGRQTSNLASISATTVASFPVPVPPEGDSEVIDRKLDLIEQCLGEVHRENSAAYVLLSKFREMVALSAVRGELSSTLSDDTYPELDVADQNFLRSELAIEEREGEMALEIQSEITPVNGIRRSLLTVILSETEPVTPEQLFNSAGFEIENVGEFYRELSSEVAQGNISETPDRRLIAFNRQ